MRLIRSLAATLTAISTVSTLPTQKSSSRSSQHSESISQKSQWDARSTLPDAPCSREELPREQVHLSQGSGRSTTGVSIQTGQPTESGQPDPIAEVVHLKNCIPECLKPASQSHETPSPDEFYDWMIQVFRQKGVLHEEEFAKAFMNKYGKAKILNEPRGEPTSGRKSSGATPLWVVLVSIASFYVVFLAIVVAIIVAKQNYDDKKSDRKNR